MPTLIHSAKPGRPRARYRHTRRFYGTAHQLHDAMKDESPAMQKIFTSRLFAMAEYILTTPAGSILAERMYVALGDAWQRNRDTHGDAPIPARTGIKNCNPWDDKTVELHSTLLRALEFADGNYDDDELRQELARNGEPAVTNRATVTRSLNLIDARHRFSPTPTSNPSLEASEKELLESYRQLPPERQEDLMMIAEAYYRAHGVRAVNEDEE